MSIQKYKFNFKKYALSVTLLFIAISFTSCSNDGIEEDSIEGVEAQGLKSISKLEFISAIEAVKAELPESLKGTTIDNYFSSLKEGISLASNEEFSVESIAEFSDEIRRSVTAKSSKQRVSYASKSYDEWTDQFLDNGSGKGTYYSFRYPDTYDFNKVIYYDNFSSDKDKRDYAVFMLEDYSVSMVVFFLEVHEEDRVRGKSDDHVKLYDANAMINAKARGKYLREVESVKIEFLDANGSHNNVVSEFIPVFHPLGGVAYGPFKTYHAFFGIYEEGIFDLHLHRNQRNQIDISAAATTSNDYYDIHTVDIDLTYTSSGK